jgi:hypothetical protein
MISQRTLRQPLARLQRASRDLLTQRPVSLVGQRRPGGQLPPVIDTFCHLVISYLL